MAEKKASSAKKKPATTKKTTAKKPVTKSKAPKKVISKASSVKTPKAPVVKSFRKCPEARPFMTFKITQETVYWLIICVSVFALGTWILKVQHDVMDLYDQVEEMQINEPIVKAPVVRPEQKTPTE